MKESKLSKQALIDQRKIIKSLSPQERVKAFIRISEIHKEVYRAGNQSREHQKVDGVGKDE